MSFKSADNKVLFFKVYKCLSISLAPEQALWALGQGALESNFYSSKLATVAMNFWGIKATQSWKGAIWSAQTSEVLHGNAVRVKADFRAYGSISVGVADYLSLLDRLYGAPLRQSSFPIFLKKLQGRWATDPQYSSKVLVAIERCRALIPPGTETEF